MRGNIVRLVMLFTVAVAARASVTLLLEEPYGTFGGMNPTGHAAIYLSNVCAASPISLRRCNEGEKGVVISRYHRVAGYDWIAIPLIPYLYAIDESDQVPSSVTPGDVAELRDTWRRRNLLEIIPNAEDGGIPSGDWIQLVGSAYDRTLYAFEIQTTQAQDDQLIQTLNSGPNKRQFNLLFRNCADFSRNVMNLYFPGALHRSLIADLGIMTPRQAAMTLMNYGKKHDVPISVFIIPQVEGTVPRSFAVRGVMESLVRSKRYAVPLVSLAAIHPFFGGGMAFAWIEGRHFDPRKLAEADDSPRDPDPATVADELHPEQTFVNHGRLLLR